jgi:hypothetical protein
VIDQLQRIPPLGGREPIGTQAQLPALRPALRRTATRGLGWPSLRYVGGIVLIAAAYYGAAKLGQTLRYTASVSAIWPPAGFGIAALYLPAVASRGLFEDKTAQRTRAGKRPVYRPGVSYQSGLGALARPRWCPRSGETPGFAEPVTSDWRAS